MKVKFDIGNILKTAFKLTAIGIVGYVAVDDYRYAKINLERCKNEIYLVDSNRYNNFSKQYKERTRYADYKAWSKERDLMYDSLEKLSISKKAYFEGINNIK